MAFKTQKQLVEYFKTFKKLDGTKIEDISKYIDEYIAASPYDEHEIFIGTDSQKIRKRNLIWYATVVCIYKKGKGAHIVYTKDKRQDIVGILNRLREEVNYSLGLAIHLRDTEILYKTNLVKLHLDLSKNVKDKSNAIYNEMTGWVTGMGFDWTTKPESPASSYAADMVVRLS